MTLQEFHNGLRILTSIDFHEMVEAGVLDDDDGPDWEHFRSDPYSLDD